MSLGGPVVSFAPTMIFPKCVTVTLPLENATNKSYTPVSLDPNTLAATTLKGGNVSLDTQTLDVCLPNWRAGSMYAAAINNSTPPPPDNSGGCSSNLSCLLPAIILPVVAATLAALAAAYWYKKLGKRTKDLEQAAKAIQSAPVERGPQEQQQQHRRSRRSVVPPPLFPRPEDYVRGIPEQSRAKEASHMLSPAAITLLPQMFAAPNVGPYLAHPLDYLDYMEAVSRSSSPVGGSPYGTPVLGPMLPPYLPYSRSASPYGGSPVLGAMQPPYPHPPALLGGQLVFVSPPPVPDPGNYMSGGPWPGHGRSVTYMSAVPDPAFAAMVGPGPLFHSHPLSGSSHPTMSSRSASPPRFRPSSSLHSSSRGQARGPAAGAGFGPCGDGSAGSSAGPGPGAGPATYISGSAGPFVSGSADPAQPVPVSNIYASSPM